MYRLEAAANDLIERTSATAWEKCISPDDIRRALRDVARVEDRLRELIIEHNMGQVKAEKAAGDSAIGLELALHEIRVPDDKAVDEALKNTINLRQCVLREDVPDQVVHAHIRGLLVRREIRILCEQPNIDPSDVLA